MVRNFKGYVPPVGFFYSVSLLSMGGSPGPPSDEGFQEVSGLSVKMETTEIKEGGDNRLVYKVPVRTTYEDLVLKRGLLVRSSPLAIWCREHLSGGLNKKIDPRTVKVSLLDANTVHQVPIMTWVFENAYPLKWEVSALDARKSEIVVESLTLAYALFKIQYEKGANDYPKNPN